MGRRCRVAAALAVAAATAVVVPASVAADASVYTSLAVATTFSVDLSGNGHGHGLSQYGAEGAAEQGLGYRRILSFYYPHTRLVTEPVRRIRVLLSTSGRSVTVKAQPGLHVSGVTGTLPTKGVSEYRLVADRRGGIGLLARRGGRWRPVAAGLPATTAVHRRGTVRLYPGDGTSTAYRGRLLAVRRSSRAAAGLLAVNDVRMDDYVAGVVPREMPASWDPAAVRAQAVAARTYADYEAQHEGGSTYDICDTTSCQVYGGAAHYAADGSLLWTDDPAAVAGDENQYLDYQGAPIFAQFSASDGGWTVDGGLPYLTAHADPYDTAASGNPYVDYRAGVSSADVASYFGLAKLTGITIASRDGNGAWGGRVTAARISGLDASGASKSVTTDGQNLEWAMGVGTDLLRLTPDNPPRGQLQSVVGEKGGVRVTGWALDTDHAAFSPQLRVRVGGRVAGTFRTHIRRPRIARRYALAYRHPGFHRLVRFAAGRRRVCVAVLDSDGLPARRLGCRTVRIPAG